MTKSDRIDRIERVLQESGIWWEWASPIIHDPITGRVDSFERRLDALEKQPEDSSLSERLANLEGWLTDEIAYTGDVEKRVKALEKNKADKPVYTHGWFNPHFYGARSSTCENKIDPLKAFPKMAALPESELTAMKDKIHEMGSENSKLRSRVADLQKRNDVQSDTIGSLLTLNGHPPHPIATPTVLGEVCRCYLAKCNFCKKAEGK